MVGARVNGRRRAGKGRRRRSSEIHIPLPNGSVQRAREVLGQLSQSDMNVRNQNQSRNSQQECTQVYRLDAHQTRETTQSTQIDHREDIGENVDRERRRLRARAYTPNARTEISQPPTLVRTTRTTSNINGSQMRNVVNLDLRSTQDITERMLFRMQRRQAVGTSKDTEKLKLACRMYGITKHTDTKAINNIHRDLKTKHRDVYDRLWNTKNLLDTLDTCASEQQAKLVGDYAVRRFELATETFTTAICEICTTYKTIPGVFNNETKEKFLTDFKHKQLLVYLNSNNMMYERLNTQAFQDSHTEDNGVRTSACILMERVCRKCYEDMKKKNKNKDGMAKQPMFSTANNFSHGVPIPQCLADLTFAEESLISAIQPVMAARILKWGTWAVSGHTSYIDRTDTISAIATELPRLPQDIEMIVLRRQTGNNPVKYYDMRCRRSYVRAALEWLIEHSPAYEGITISEDNIQRLSVDAEISDQVRSVEVDGLASTLEDEGPAPGQRDAADRQNVGGLDAEGYVNEMDTSGIQTRNPRGAGVQNFTNRINESLREHFDAETGNMCAVIEQPFATDRISISDIPYFWGKAWPCVFMPELVVDNGITYKDIPAGWHRGKARIKNPELWEWATYIINAHDGRYERHPTFKFSVMNIKARSQTMSCTSHVVRQLGSDVPATRGELVEYLGLNSDLTTNATVNTGNQATDNGDTSAETARAINTHHRNSRRHATTNTDNQTADNGDTSGETAQTTNTLHRNSRRQTVGSLAYQITGYSLNIKGTPQYWWARRQEVEALVHHLYDSHDTMPLIFSSATMAEYHWSTLHRCISDLLLRWGRLDEAESIRPGSEQGRNLHAILQQHPQVLNRFFVLRCQAWFRIVLGEGLGIKDYWARFEFAKSRGAIHLHALLWKESACTKIHECLDEVMRACNMKPEDEELQVPDAVDNIIQRMEAAEDVAIKNITETLPEVLTGITALHPAGRKRTSPETDVQTPYYMARVKVARLDREIGTTTDNETLAMKDKMVIGEDVPWTMVGNVDKWPKHEGGAEKPPADCLARRSFDVKQEDMQQHDIDLMNRTSLHTCSSYCLRKKGTKTLDDGQKVDLFKCRLGFGYENKLVSARTDGRKVCSQPYIDTKKGVSVMECERDHPRLVQGSRDLTRAWAGNYDTQLILGLKNDLPDVSGSVMNWCNNTYSLRTRYDTSANDRNNGNNNTNTEAYTAEQWSHMLDSETIEQRNKRIEQIIYEARRHLQQSRVYTNRDAYVQRICDYVVGYACKGEISACEAQKIFRKLIESDLPEGTSLQSLAIRLNMRILKSREISAGECCMCLSSEYMYMCSRTFLRISLDIGRRRVLTNQERADMEERGEETEDVGVKANAFDQYCESKNKLEEELDGAATTEIDAEHNTVVAQALDYSFHEYNTNKIENRDGIPVYYHGTLNALWPLEENYCRTMIMLHDKSLRDGGFMEWNQSAVFERFWHLIDNELFPSHVRNSIIRAAIQATYGRESQTGDNITGTIGGGAAAQHVGDTDRSQSEATPLDVLLNRGESALFANAAQDIDHELVVRDFREAEAGTVPNVDRVWLGGRTVEDLNDISDNVRDRYYSVHKQLCMHRDRRIVRTHNGEETYNYVNPLLCLKNQRQRYIITAYMEHLLTSKEIREQQRWVLLGVAGTGKSFVMSIMDTLAKLDNGDAYASMIAAPTGAAAGNVGGCTLDRLAGFKRNAKEYCSLAEGNRALKFADDQKKYRNTILLMCDECFMCGKRIMGHFCMSCSELFNRGAHAEDILPTAGRVDTILLAGDCKQLPPVCDTTFLDDKLSSVNIDNMGTTFWKQFDQFWTLTEPVRQSSGGPLISALTNLRTGYGDVDNSKQRLGKDLAFWGGRTRERVGRTEYNKFSIQDDSTLFATCYNRDRDAYNLEYISNFNEVYVVKAKISGKSSCVGNVDGSSSLGMAGAIPITSYLAIGMMVKITVNIIPEVKLANQSRGVIRDIIYRNGYNRNEIPIVVLEMPEYKGPQFVTPTTEQAVSDINYAKYIIIGAHQLRCDCKNCSRTGLPIRVAKADSIHSLQGMTIGQKKAIKRMVLKWSQRAEGLWANILYVGGSRVEKDSDILLAQPISQVDLKKVATSKACELQHKALQDMHSKADTQLQSRMYEYNNANPGAPAWGSEEHYVDTLQRFITLTRR